MNEPPVTENSPTPAPTQAPTGEQTPTPTEESSPSLVNQQEEVEAAPAVEFVPVTAEDLTFPEGFEVNEELRDETLTIFNNRELSPKEQLQQLVDLQLKSAQLASQAVTDAWETTQKAWQDEVRADPKIGGGNLPATLERIGKAIDEYGDDATREAFNVTGAGNHPAIIRFVNALAEKLVEAGAHVSGAPKTTETSAAARMFPSMKGSNG